MPSEALHRLHPKSVWRRHSLSIVTGIILTCWISLYLRSSPDTHWGSFFCNAIADWSGLLITVITTKFLYEKGSKESRQPAFFKNKPTLSILRTHSLSLFFVLTGLGWLYLFSRMSPTSKWGQVVGNLLSEWTQILGVVLLTKRLIEVRSKE